MIVEKEAETTSQVLDAADDTDAEATDQTEPDLDVYANALLLVDALERHDVTALQDMETDALVNIYTLLSDVQRNANDLCQDVADVLLSRLHHDRPVSGPFGSVQRTTRRNRSLKDEEEVLDTLAAAGIGRERVMGVDRDKVDDALAVTDLSESDVYEIEASDTVGCDSMEIFDTPGWRIPPRTYSRQYEYVRKAEVDEDRKETRPDSRILGFNPA